MKKIIIGVFLLIVSLYGSNAFSQKIYEVDIKPEESVLSAIKNANDILQELRGSICANVASLSQKAGAVNKNGVMEYANWVQFVYLGQRIEELNDQWNEAYAEQMEKIIAEIHATKSCPNCSNIPNNQVDDLLADEIEDNYLKFPEDIASCCFEEMHSFRSLRNCLNDADETYLNSGEGTFNAGQTPSNLEEFDDEEFWTLINCNKEFTLVSNVVDNSIFTEGEDDTQKKDILTTIKDILGVIGQAVGIVNQLADLMKDCAGTETVKDKSMRDGFEFDNGNRQFGYVMVQKGVLIDFQQTTTKIKGKIKLWKKNKRGKWRKDRKTKSTLDFCAFEWDGCNGKEWPSDGHPYIHPKATPKRKKNKIKYYHPSALQIDKSTHFLQFHFGYNQTYNFITGFNLLGNTGCGPASNLGWN